VGFSDMLSESAEIPSALIRRGVLWFCSLEAANEDHMRPNEHRLTMPLCAGSSASRSSSPHHCGDARAASGRRCRSPA